MASQVIPVPFADCKAPDWASSWGQDEYGFFADFSLPRGSMYWDFLSQRMRWIPPGTFLMGSPEGEEGRSDREQRHDVTLTRGFWLADTTCRQELWEAVMDENPSRFRGEQLPVEQVTYDDIQRFFDRVSAIAAGLHLELPTEAQWEYACRAGTETPFSFGEDITTDQANYDGNYPYRGSAKGEFREKTIVCDALPANRWGLFQMHGNVWEWCRDWHGPYSEGEQIDPVGPKNGSDRVIRGGGWIIHARDVRSAYRCWYRPGDRGDLLGFRCLSSVSPAAEKRRTQ